MKGKNGFTLLEALITLTIAAILLIIGGPSFVGFIKQNQLLAHSNNLLSQLHLARSESVKRSASVIICRSEAPDATVPSCQTDGNDWSNGWIIFQDVNGNNDYNDGTDNLLSVSDKLSQSNFVIRANSNNKISFNSQGRLGTSIKLAICDDRDGNGTYEQTHGSEISVSLTGYPSTLETVTFNSNCIPQ